MNTSSWGNWMQWRTSHGPEHIMSHYYLHKILEFSWFSEWDVESTSELDFEGNSTSMGPSGPRFELIYLIGMSYEGDQIDFRFTFLHKGLLVIMQGCTRVSEQGLWIGLID